MRPRLALAVAVLNVGLVYGIAVISQPILRWSPETGPDKTAIIEGLRAEGIETYPGVFAASFLDRTAVDPRIARGRLELPTLGGVAYQPLSGLPEVRTVLCHEDDGWLVYDSDAWGFNNPGRKPEGSELLVLGDSYVQGSCVPAGSSFVDLLHRPDRSVYSLGLGSSGPLVTLAQIKEYSDRVSATRVLWVFTASNDVMRRKPRASDLDVELGSPTLVRYLDEQAPLQNLIERKAELASQIRDQIDERMRDGRTGSVPLSDDLRLVELRARVNRIRISLQHKNEAARHERLEWYRAHRIPVLQSIMEEAKRFLAERNKELYVAYLPTRKPHALKEDFLAAFQSAGLPTLDLEKEVDMSAGFFATGSGSHFSVDGNRQVAEAIDRALVGWQRGDLRTH